MNNTSGSPYVGLRLTCSLRLRSLRPRRVDVGGSGLVVGAVVTEAAVVDLAERARSGVAATRARHDDEGEAAPRRGLEPHAREARGDDFFQ